MHTQPNEDSSSQQINEQQRRVRPSTRENENGMRPNASLVISPEYSSQQSNEEIPGMEHHNSKYEDQMIEDGYAVTLKKIGDDNEAKMKKIRNEYEAAMKQNSDQYDGAMRNNLKEYKAAMKRNLNIYAAAKKK